MSEPRRPRRRERNLRLNVMLTDAETTTCQRLADMTDEGNMSRLVRRLLREEAARVARVSAVYPHTIPTHATDE